MAWSLPRALRTLRAALCHTQHALPLRSPCPCVVTVHDVSFAREPEMMGWKDRAVFRRVVPHAVKRAARVLTVSERTKRDLVELYDVPAERIVVTPNGVDPAFTPGPGRSRLRPLGRGDPGPQEPARGARRSRRGRAAARRRRPGEGRRARRRAPAARREARGLRRRRRGSSSCTAAPRASCSRAGTRASGCPWSRRWRRGHRSSPSPIRPFARWPARRRCSSDGGDLAERDPHARSPSATASSRRGSSAPARSAGARPRSGRSPSTGRYSGHEGLGGRRLARARRRARQVASRARPAGRRGGRDLERSGLGRRACPTASACSRTRGRSPWRRTSTSGSPRRRVSTC